MRRSRPIFRVNRRAAPRRHFGEDVMWQGYAVKLFDKLIQQLPPQPAREVVSRLQISCQSVAIFKCCRPQFAERCGISSGARLASAICCATCAACSQSPNKREHMIPNPIQEVRYTEALPPAFLCAYWWSKYAPRAKGWLPRRIGRSVGRNMTCFVRTRAGASLAVDPFNLDFYCLVKVRNGVWEEDVIDACLKSSHAG